MIKDALILVVVVFLGLYLPLRYRRRHRRRCSTKIAAAKPGFLAFPRQGAERRLVHLTVVLTALGFFMWPHSFASAYTAQDERVCAATRSCAALRPDAAVRVLCRLRGAAAGAGTDGGDTDLALFKLAAQEFPPVPWSALIGAAGVFTALVPGSLIAMTAAMLLSKNLIGVLRPEATDGETVALAKWLVPVVMLVAVYFTLTGNATIVTMLLVGYSFVTQLFPAVVMSLTPRNPTTPAGAFAGILVGAVVAAVLSFTHATIGSLFPALPQAIRDLNVGIIALAANIVAMAVVSAATRPRAVPAGAV